MSENLIWGGMEEGLPKTGRRCAARTMESTWTTDIDRDPSMVYSGSTIHIPLSGSGSEYVLQKSWTSAHGYTCSSASKENSRWTLAISNPSTPGSSEPLSRKMQSRRGLVAPPDFNRGMDRIVSRYMPPIPDGLLGAQNTAYAE